jgi:hypothetical protein
MESLSIIDSFWSRLEQCEYKAPELMSTLLICTEERYFAKKAPNIQSSMPRPMGYPELIFNVPAKMGEIENFGEISAKNKIWEKDFFQKNAAQKYGAKKEMRGMEEKYFEEKENFERKENERRRGQGAVATAGARIKIVSIREMLLHYFKKYPSKYRQALASAIAGIESAESAQMRDIIEAEIERIGVWEFAIKVWEKVLAIDGKRRNIWDKVPPINAGVSPPESEEDLWLVCPKWRKNFSDDDIREIAKMIMEHMTQSN